jgi:hypothetical protein
MGFSRGRLCFPFSVDEDIAMTAAMPVPQFAFPDPWESFRPWFALPKSQEKAIPPATYNALKPLYILLDESVSDALEITDPDEFLKRRAEAFEKYLRHLGSIVLVSSEVRSDNLRGYTETALVGLREEFAALEVEKYGVEAAEQVDFFIFTMGKIFRLVFESQALDDSRQAEDPALRPPSPKVDQATLQMKRSMVFLLWSNFHMNCLRLVLERRLKKHPEITRHILDGMATCSLAYAHLRVCRKRQESQNLPFEDSSAVWDDEDRALLDASEQAWVSLT